MDRTAEGGIVDCAVNGTLPSLSLDGNRSWDDIKQEAVIGVWKAREKLGDDLKPGQVYQAARWAAIAEVKRQLGLRRESQQPLSLDRDTDEWEKEGDWVASADADVDMAVDIARALSTLEPWERAFLVHWFYEGVPAREAAHLAGTTYAKAQTRWSKITRPRLARMLSTYRDRI